MRNFYFDINKFRKGQGMKLIFVLLFILFISFLLPIVLKGNEKSIQTYLPIKTYDLFDLGVSEINQDDFLDVFTVNHSARQSLLINDQRGEFVDRLSEYKFDQDYQFPALEDTDSSPIMNKSGLYIYRQNRLLHLQAHNIDKLAVGTIEVPWPMDVLVQKNATVKILKKKSASGVMVSTINFSIENGGSISINGNEDIIELPHIIQLSNMIPLNHIFVGKEAVSPKSHRFKMIWRDRHSMAWSELNNDEKTDLFISRGGIKGKMGLLPQEFDRDLGDELFMSEKKGYGNISFQSGLQKNNCPGRQASWLDFNNDDRLDLYVVCGRPEEAKFPNQFYVQTNNGEFIDSAAKFGIDFLEDNPFVWLHADSDDSLDLLTAKNRRIVLLKRYKGEIFQENFITEGIKGSLRKFAINDFDHDGDYDVFVVASEGSFLLLGNNGTFVQKNPEDIGLPQQAITANWVDFDNDGLTDLYLVPGGIYRQLPNHHFTQTRLLEIKTFINRVVDARCSWFDIDNDGDRDLLTAVRYNSRLPLPRMFNDVDRSKANPSTGWKAKLFRNGFSTNHWIEFKLVGNRGNRLAIGASLQLKGPYGLMKQQVGFSEGSHSSQGHYRLYFGLGQTRRVDEVTVTWNDGSVQKIKNPKIDQLHTIKKVS
jgi:hypothetical protein